jgi:hypothetical protein
MPHHCRTGTPVLEARLSDQSSQRLARGRNRSRLSIAGSYLLRYAQEMAWREDRRRVSNGEQVYGVVG